MKRIPLIVCSVAVIAFAGAMVRWSNRAAVSARITEFTNYDTRDGKKEAEEDIVRGDPKWKVYGSGSYEEESERLKRLGIKVDHFHGSIVSEGIVRYRYTYNSTIYVHFAELMGQEVTEEVLGRAPVDPQTKHDT